MMWCWPPQWSKHEVPSRCLDHEALSPLVKSVCFFSFKVVLNSPVNVLTMWFPCALFEISIAIPSRSVNRESICFPIEFWVLFPSESWRRMSYLCICTVLSLWFVYFRIMFLPSEVKPCSRILFPQLVLIFLMGCSSWMIFIRVLLVLELALLGYP